MVRWNPGLMMISGALFFLVAVSGRNRSTLTEAPLA